MIEDVKNLITVSNDINDGVIINSDIDEYILKLAKFSTIIPYYSNCKLKGFIAYYANDELRKEAYLSMIIIDKFSRGEGLGKLLLESSICDLSQRGFVKYKLEVLKSNAKAYQMYKKYGFVIEEDRGKLWMMVLNIDINNRIG